MFLKKSKSGRWKCRVFVGRVNGKQRRITQSFDDRKSAENWAKEREVEFSKTGVVPVAGSLTVGQLLDNWLALKKTKFAPTTMALYTHLIDAHIKPELGEITLRKLSADHVEKFYNKCVLKVAASTVELIHAVLFSAIQDKVRKGELHRNPCAGADRPKAKKFIGQTWDAEDVSLFLGEAKRSSRLYAFFLFQLSTGCRPGEAMALTWDDFDSYGNVRINKKAYKFSKRMREIAGVTETYQVGRPKSDAGIRDIPLRAVVVGELKKLKAAQAERRELLAERYHDQNLVFCTEFGKFLTPSSLRNEFARIVKLAKVKPIRLYDCRHTYASTLIVSGVDPTTVKELMGHSSTSITMDVYSHLMTGAKKNALEKLEARLFATPAVGKEG